MYNHTNNLVRGILMKIGVLFYRFGLARFIIGLSPNRLRALLYHAVEDVESDYTRGLDVTVSTLMFERNLEYFKQYYNVMSISSLGEAVLERSLVITFDDGYASVYDHAYPALKRQRMLANIYLNSCAVENQLIWVNVLNWAMFTHWEESLVVFAAFPELAALRERAQIISYVQNHYLPEQIESLCDSLRKNISFDNDHGLYVTPEQIRKMRSDGITFGFHTRDHYNLRNCDATALDAQLDSSSLDDLLNCNSFAYPFGYFDPQAVVEVSRRGYKSIMTVGYNSNRSSTLHLDRVEVVSADPAVVFAQLEIVEPVMNWLRGCYLKMKSSSDSTMTLHQA